MFLIPFFIALQVGTAAQTPARTDPPRSHYRADFDYHLPRGAETLLWIDFTLDATKWPKRREVGISRTGVLVLEWATQNRGRLTPMRLFPHEVRELFDVIENRVRFTSLRSQPRGKDAYDYLSGQFEYGLPSRASGSHGVF